MNTRHETRPGRAVESAPRRSAAAAAMLAPLAICLLTAAGCSPAPTGMPGVTSMFNGRDLAGWRVLAEDYFELHGKVGVKDGAMVLGSGLNMTGVAWKGDFPTDDYEIELEAMRVDGEDFFCGMTFPVAGSRASFIIGGFGGFVVGISNVDGLAADENETTKVMEFKKNRWYGIRLRVAAGTIEGWIDEQKVVDLATKNRKFTIWPQQEPIKTFGITTWCTTGALRNITLCRLDQI